MFSSASTAELSSIASNHGRGVASSRGEEGVNQGPFHRGVLELLEAGGLVEGDACWEGFVDDALAFLEEFGGEFFVGSRDVTRRTDGRRSSAVASRGRHYALTGQTLARSLLAVAGCHSSVGVSHTLRGKIAFVHPLGAVLAWCSSILVDTFGLPLATPYTGSSSTEGRRPDDR